MKRILILIIVVGLLLTACTSNDLCKDLVPKEATSVKMLNQMPVGYSCVWFVQGNVSGTYEQHSAWIKLDTE